MTTESRSKGKTEHRNNLAVPMSDDEVQSISGNAPQHLKEAAVRWYKLLGTAPVGMAPGYATYGSIARSRQRITEVSLEHAPESGGEPQKAASVKTVVELEVSADMCNALGVMDQGCMTGILDEGSAIALILQKISEYTASEGEDAMIGVSQSFNFVFYQPVPAAGAKLRIVSRSISSEAGSTSCEIWDVVRNRLVVSGTQIQMSPSR